MRGIGTGANVNNQSLWAYKFSILQFILIAFVQQLGASLVGIVRSYYVCVLYVATCKIINLFEICNILASLWFSNMHIRKIKRTQKTNL